MRKIKVSTWVPGFSLAILFAGVGTLVLGTFSSSFIGARSWAENNALQFGKKAPSKGSSYPPIFAYWISGTRGDTGRLIRLLKAVYHPRNQYLLHLDATSSSWERNKLAVQVQSEKVFNAFGNVEVVGKPFPTDQLGSSAIAAVLHAAAVLLKINVNWDWLITLTASDYPLVTQDDLLHVFSSLPRNLNFIHQTNSIGWKESQRLNHIVIDPNLYMTTNTPIFQVKESRPTPDAYKIFTGSPWMILSRAFTEYCVHGWDNLPRKLLIYFSNGAFPLESYFHTVLCNSPEFINTTVNNDLRFIVWDTPPQLEPKFLCPSHYEEMVSSGAAFARRFKDGDHLLEMVDELILRRQRDAIVPGKWCLGLPTNTSMDSVKESSCLSWGDIDIVEPGPRAEKLKGFVSGLVAGKL